MLRPDEQPRLRDVHLKQKALAQIDLAVPICTKRICGRQQAGAAPRQG
jgi:hypothetical protein